MPITNYDNWLADEGPDYCDECGGVLTTDAKCKRCLSDFGRDADRDNTADFDEPEEGEEF